MDITTKSVRGGVLTREQFLPHEMRIVAALRMQGASDEQVSVRVKSENLFQYPTERMVANRPRTPYAPRAASTPKPPSRLRHP